MADRSDPEDIPAAETVRRLIMGFRTTQLIHACAQLGIADLLRDGSQNAPSMARATGAHPQALYRLLRALASLGFFAEDGDGRFELTALGQTLRSGTPGSLRDLAVLYGEQWIWNAYGSTLHSVMTGEPAFATVHGQTLFEYMHLHADAAAAFDRAMSAYSEHEAGAVLAAYDFSGVAAVVDVGGGHGGLLAAILKACPQVRGVLFEQSSVIDGARSAMTRAGVADRCTMRPGNFFEAVPTGGDVYILKSVLHNWDDRRSSAILNNCRDAMREGAKLLIIERLIPEGNEPAEAKLFDINMLVVLGGMERTRKEYQNLLSEAGYELARVIPTKSPVSIVESVRR
jgi:hypothetical protein